MIQDVELKKKVIEFLKNPMTDLDAEYLPLEKCPAGVYHHHSYEGGLLQHTISVIKLSMILCDLVEENYNGEVNRDTVLAGAILHDLMKCYCYTTRADSGGYDTSELGEKIDHLSLMVSELYKKKFPINIVHTVASHHGEISPTKPKTIEALIVSIADQADSDLNGKLLRAAEYLLRRNGELRPRINSSKEALNIIKAKSIGGWEGLEKFLNGELY
jgi:7,8-dihydroneopterin 2',3'-cyclic phosphate phosphodiesterase